MTKLLLCFIFCLLMILGSESITDKEYANLPPVFEADNFDRCLLLEDDALYCYVEYHVKPIDPHNPSRTWRNIQELSSNPKNYRHDNLRLAICVPLTCPNISRSSEDPDFKKDLADCYNKKYESYGIYGTIEHMYCQTKEPKKLDFLDTTVLILLITYVLLVIYASFYEGLARYKTTEEYKRITSTQFGQFMSCFSIPKNWIRLKTIESTPDNERFKSLQGVRFYNMFIVILVHATMLCIGVPLANTQFAEGMFDHPLAIFMASGPFAVSTFFQISAMFLTYQSLKRYNEKSGKEFNLKTILWALLYRYIRLTPSMAIILILHSTLLHHTGRGPWWDEFLGIDLQNCRKNGWTNLLYINNWINPSQMCLVETWYLAIDMQAFILVLVFLYFTVKHPKRFWFGLVTVWIVNHIYIAWFFYKKEIFHCLRPYPENLYMMKALYIDDGIWINTISFLPINLAGTIVGTGAGFLAYKYENSQFLTSKTRLVIWWILTYGGALSIIVLPGMWLFSRSYYDSYWFSLPYLTLGPTIFSLAICLAITGVTQGHGWWMKTVLEWPPVYYLGRISYTTFLAHYSLIFYIMASNKQVLSIDDFTVISECMKILSMSLILGLLLSLFVEFPTSALSSLYLKRKIVDEKYKNGMKQKSS